MAGWTTLRNLVDCEFTQSIEEGKDPAAVESLRAAFDAAGEDVSALDDIMRQLQSLPLRDDLPFDEPGDLPAIQALRAGSPRTLALPYGDSELHDRMYGAWLARCAGCALGKPVEGFMHAKGDLASKDRTKRYLEAISPDEWPLRGYFPAHSPTEEQTGNARCPMSTREQIAFMESDDDIRYTVIGQLVMRRSGAAFTTRHVAEMWFKRLPMAFVCTAETQAYRNLAWRYGHPRMWPDDDIDWTWVATHHNPYREWIGAQIRADSWGYAAPGRPELAAAFAWRDARLSHVKNGIYGEMFVAAMIAAAFVHDSPRDIIEAGLAEIPRTSRLYSEMRQTMAICEQHGCRHEAFQDVIDDIYALLGHYDAVHTNNNAALVVAALLLGGHDLEKVITIAVMGGWDTDCNGATAGSIAGAMLGANRLPAKWIDPLNDTLNSEVHGYHPIPISECAKRSVAIAKQVLAE